MSKGLPSVANHATSHDLLGVKRQGLSVNEIHNRLRAELLALGMKPADAARAAGMPDSQGLRDVLSGRKRLTVELLSSLATTGIDLLFVVTGERGSVIAPKSCDVARFARRQGEAQLRTEGALQALVLTVAALVRSHPDPERLAEECRRLWLQSGSPHSNPGLAPETLAGVAEVLETMEESSKVPLRIRPAG